MSIRFCLNSVCDKAATSLLHSRPCRCMQYWNTSRYRQSLLEEKIDVVSGGTVALLFSSTMNACLDDQTSSTFLTFMAHASKSRIELQFLVP